MKYLVVLVAVAACNSGRGGANGDASAGDAGGDAQVCNASGVAGCACSPVGVNQSGTLVPSRPITKLVTDPVRCRAYGLADQAVLVFDTKTKLELAPIAIEPNDIDFDISSDGARLIVAHRMMMVTLIDLEQLAVKSKIPLLYDPGRVEISAAGQAYYVDFDQFASIHRLDLTTWNEAVVATRIAYYPDIELSADDSKLFVGDSQSSSSALYEFDTSTFVQTGRSQWNQNLDFENATRHVFVSHAGNMYYAQHQWRGLAISTVTGGTAEDILAESDDGTVAIGTARSFDVALAAPMLAFPHAVTAATFTAAGQEAWLYDGASIRYVATADLVGPTPLGAREVPAQPLASYTLVQLLYDPAHGVLYGRDSTRNAIVVIDATTLLPTREIRVGTAPSDMALDPDGSMLYVGHADQQAFAVIDRATATFVRFVQTSRLPFELEPAGAGRLITADMRYDSAPTLFDVASGNFAPTTQNLGFAALSVSADEKTLFVGSGSDLFKFSIGATSLALLAHTAMAFNAQQRLVVAHPLATSVFYGVYSVDAADLTTVRYTTANPVLAVSPDGRIALAQSTVIDVATGVVLGALPVTSQVVAISGDSHMAYLLAGSQIQAVALDSFH